MTFYKAYYFEIIYGFVRKNNCQISR